MIVIAHCLVEALDRSDENILLPLHSCGMRILVVVEKESRLQACCIHNALGTFVFLWDLAREFSKDSELHHWHSYFIKAHPLGSISWCDTLSSLLDIWVSLQSCEV